MGFYELKIMKIGGAGPEDQSGMLDRLNEYEHANSMNSRISMPNDQSLYLE